MSSFAHSIATYEAMLRDTFGSSLNTDDLQCKHRKMRRSAFLFLRAACWRWAESASQLCPSLMDAPVVPSVGDAHAGNFGLWRDAQARLVWGINDYDEAARLPYVLDLVRLCGSILLAGDGASASEIADQALAGYRRAIAAPQPFILERKHLWLRDAFAATDDERRRFWRELEGAPEATVSPASLTPPLVAALPALPVVRLSARSAGAGSLGRPRFTASGVYRGGPVAAEIKGAMRSCWTPGHDTGLAQHMARGPWRSPDPTLTYAGSSVLRRFAPNNRKLEFDTINQQLRGRLIGAMAAELAAVHVAEDAASTAIDADLKKRPPPWLAHAAGRVADWTRDEFKRYRTASSETG